MSTSRFPVGAGCRWDDGGVELPREVVDVTGTVVERWQPNGALVAAGSGIVVAMAMLGWVVMQFRPGSMALAAILLPTVVGAGAGLAVLLVFLRRGGEAALAIGIVLVAGGGAYLWWLLEALSHMT